VVCCSGVLQWCVAVSLYLDDDESTDGGSVKVYIFVAVCCSRVLRWCVAVMYCSSVLQCQYTFMTMSRLMVVLSRYV